MKYYWSIFAKILEFRWDGQQFQTISDMCSNGIMGDMQSNNKNIILVCLHEKLVEIV